MTRLMVSVASRVCRVENTRWPVSAAWMAVSMVSRSRISPTRITSGSWRRAARRAVAKLEQSAPTSRWLMMERLSRCRYSMGSSMVRMCSFRVALMRSIMAARVVDLPRARGARDQHHAALLLADLVEGPGQHQVLDAEDAAGDDAEHHAHGAALVEDVAAEAAQGRDRVGQVDVQALLELRLLAVRGHDGVGHGDGVLLDQLLELGQGGEPALNPGDGVVAHLQVQVGSAQIEPRW